MNTHTPEPWYAYQREHPVGYSFGICNSRPCGTLVDEDGSLHTDFPDWNPGTSELVARTYDSEKAHANANRIVACVNACAGMADPASEIAALKAQRDELLAALGVLKELAKCVRNEDEYGGNTMDDALIDADEILAKYAPASAGGAA